MLTDHFSRFLRSRPGRLHAAAHSHHPWPDVTFFAQEQAWRDAAELHDGKWERILGEVLPEARGHIARTLGLPDPDTIATAPNTHELVVRVLSCLPQRPRILTTDGEFHSLSRQLRRLEEEDLVEVEWVACDPLPSLGERLAEAAARGGHDLVVFSHVLFGSGFVLGDLEAIVGAVASTDTYVLIDGYHAFQALPVDLSGLADRTFYVAGGYKYAMAGEGACFLHCPPGYGQRPRNSGWYAGFADLERPAGGPVTYPDDGRRFLGSTFDPSGWYRFNAVQWLLAELGITPRDIHAHVRALQTRFIAAAERRGLSIAALLVPADSDDRGNFLAYRVDDAAGLQRALAQRDVIIDHRGEVVRFGFGVYHRTEEIDDLAERLGGALASR